ncbi:MAG: SDR family oxidoreductase, partial [Gemmatimonadaceae bacterium]
YVGGRLLRMLESVNYRVRAMARRPEALRHKAGVHTEVVAGDVLDRASLDSAMRNVHTAYYLVHSMGASGSFEEADREGARNFSEAAKAAGVQRIVYLGGLGSEEEELSPHLRSRQEVGELLRQSGVPVTEFRASVVIGSGSLSFEMVRALVERLPFMITPRWVNVLTQPIAIDDLLAYLAAALQLPQSESRIFEIGGSDVVCYADIMREYAQQRGLKLRLLPVPVITPYVSSLWLGLVTPLYARVGRKLIESIIHATVVTTDDAMHAFDVQPMGIEAAIQRALAREEREFAETRWSDALSSAGKAPSWGGELFGTRLVDSRTVRIRATPAQAFAPVQAIGGETGYYAFNWLWRIRGVMDMLVGGVGMRRGRPHPLTLEVDDTVDFWRVEAIEPDKRLKLFAEMKVPGRAWLEFEVSSEGTETIIRQTAIFDPVGWLGLAYWYALYPVHELVFTGMLRGIARVASPAPSGSKWPKGEPVIT